MTLASRRWLIALLALVATPAAAQPPVAVTAATPASGEQDTIGLVVKITGKNFSQGARADFFRSGTSDPAGIAVQSTRVVSSTEAEATLNIDGAAALSTFDIRVTNTNGRSGKGSDLFTVVEKGNKVGCTVPAIDPHITLVTSLNGLGPGGTPRYKSALGFIVKARGVVIRGQPALMVVVNADPGAEVFFLSSDGAGGVAVDVVNPHRRLDAAPNLQGMRIAAIGDLNADGAPDFIAGNRIDATGAVFVGRWEPDGSLAFNAPIELPPGIGFDSVAIGDLEPALAGDEFAIGIRALSGKKAGGVYLFRLNGTSVVALTPSFVSPAVSPALSNRDLYARSMTIADVTGSTDPDLIVGAYTMASGQGEIHVFPGPASVLDASPSVTGRQPLVIRHATDAGGLGFIVAPGDVNNDGTLDVVSQLKYRVDLIRPQAALGPIGPAYAVDPAYETEAPGGADNVSLVGYVATDLDGDGITDLAGGAPNACLGGKAFVWRGTGLAPSPWNAPMVLQAATFGGHYGWAVEAGLVGGSRVLLVGETQRTIGGYASAGQVYVYRVNP